ncbi:tandem-95 repeat protein, partial [Altererythrobacter indicus]
SSFDGGNVYAVVLQVSDGNGGTATQNVQVTVTNANEAPSLAASAAVTLTENQSLATSIVATDVDGDTLSYAITGGADAALFTVGADGKLSFVTAPDFEAPGDANGDNVYDVIVTVSDGNGASASQSVAVTITDVNEAPVITSGDTIAMAEGRMAVLTMAGSDSDGDVLAWSIAGGLDASLFTIDSATGALSFITAPDYEAPADSDEDNIYQLSVKVSDGNGKSTTQSLTVTITDKNEAPVITSDAAIVLQENRTAVISVDGVDPEGTTPSFALAGGADADLFTIDETTGALAFKVAPDFEAPGTAGGSNVYHVNVAVSDGVNVTTQAVEVTVLDVNEAPVITSGLSLTVAENGTAVGTVAATDDDGDGLTFSLTGGADADLFTIDAATGALSFKVAPDYEAGQTSFVVEVSVSDGTIVTSDTVTITLTDVNEAPVITSALDVTVIEGDAGPVLFEAEDPDGDTLSWSIEPGGDGALFTIDGATGEISFKTAPDYANPADSDGDNVYALTITVDDGNGKSVTQDVTITVTDTNEAPEITSGGSVSLDENTTAVLS